MEAAQKLKIELTGEFKLPMGILAGAIAPDQNSIVAGCLDGVYRADLESQSFEKLYRHESYVSSVHWLGSGLILSAGYDGVVKWFDPDAGKTLRKLDLHDFWSWDMGVSPDEKRLASVTGQYLAGGYKYKPLPESEPSLKIVDVESGEIIHALSHVPSVQAVAFSPDGRNVAAGNLMGEVRIFDVESGEQFTAFTTDAFTSWGIIKSHSYIGGIFAIKFTPDGEHILLAGMGPMRDPMAGNGRQLWQRWSWREGEPELVDQTHEGESGEGLMETLALHPTGDHFIMAGRLRGGDWNAGVFDLTDGDRIAKLKTGYRVTTSCYSADGSRLILMGAQGQPKERNENGEFPHFGRVQVFDVADAADA